MRTTRLPLPFPPALLLLALLVVVLSSTSTYVAGFQTPLPLPTSRVSPPSSRRHAHDVVVMRAGDDSSSSSSSTKKSGRGFGEGVKRTAKSSNGGGDGRTSSLRPRAPNSFSSIGKAVRLRGKFGGGPMGMGLLDGYSKLMEQAEAVKERYSGRRPVQEGGGRQRGAKKAATFHALSSYSLHFLRLLEEELVYEEAEVMQRLRYWPRGRLMEEGLAVFGVVARPRGKLFKEYILRFTLPARKGSSSSSSSSNSSGSSTAGASGEKGGGVAGKKGPPSRAWEGSRGSGSVPPSSKKGGSGPPGAGLYPRAPPLQYHRLGPGDIISITPDKQNPLGSDQVIEGLVLERGAFYVDVVVKEIPPGVVWRRGDPTGGERFRLDLYLNRISFQRMVAAVHQVTGLETGYTVSPEIRDILVKSFAERFESVFPNQSGGGGGGGGGAGGGVGGQKHSLLAMSPYAAAAAANKKAARQQTLAKRMREDEDAGRGGRKAKRSSSSSSGATATITTTITTTTPRKRKDKDGSSPVRKSSWEALASAVPKTSFARKDAEQMVSQEVSRFKLNDSQEKALRMALSRKLSLIQGPPGTGKTRTACHLVNIAVKLGQRRDSGKVLAVAFSNVAADNLLEGCLRLGLNAVRVGRAATVRPELRNHTLDALLMQHQSVSTFKKKLEASRGSTSREVQAAKRDLEDAELMAAVSILGNADVVVSTCVGAANEVIINAASVTGGISDRAERERGGNEWDDDFSPSSSSSRSSSPLRAIKFPTVIIDEASQATEPATLIPLTQGCEQLVLVGDHYQLPPTIKSMRAAQQGLGVSLFTRLAMAGIQPSLLTLQYRMHPFIAQFPSQRFYGGLLQSHPANIHKRPRPEGFPWPHPTLPVAFVAVGGDEDDSPYAPFFEQRTNGNQTSYLNRKEADVLMEVLGGVLRRGQVLSTEVGIVTPYSAQVKHVTELAQNRLRNFKPAELEIQSVDAYQGREKELILMSAVRSNNKGKVGFLGDWRRLNVAITRAKRGLIVLGDPRTLRHDPHWSAYLRWAQKHGCVMTLAELRERLD